MKGRQTDQPVGTAPGSLRRRLLEADRTINALLAGELDVVLDPSSRSAASLRDVEVELQRLDHEMQISEAYFRSLIENLSDLVTILAPDGTIQYISPSIRTVLGYEPEERLGRRAFDLMHPDDVERVSRFMREAIQAGHTAARVAYRYRHKDGSWRHVESAGVNLLADPGVSGLLVISRDISERVAMEGRYRSLFENMVEGFAHGRVIYEQGKPCDFVFLETNRAFVTLTGLRDVVGQRASVVLPGIHDTSPELLAIYDRVARGGGQERFETYVPALKAWFSVSAYGPEPQHFVAVFDNITERKRAEAQLHAQDRQLQAIVEAVNDIVFEFDEAGRYLNVWAADETKLARPKAELLGRRVADVLGADAAGPFVERFRRVVRSGVPESLEYALTLADGEHWFFGTIKRLPGGESAPATLCMGIADITDRKRAEDALRRSEADHRELVEHAPLGIYRSTPDGRLLAVNPALVAMLGYDSSDDLLRLNVSSVYADKAERERLKSEAARLGEATAEVEWRRKDGKGIVVRLHARAARSPTGKAEHFDALADDVTEERSLERQFRQAQKMEAVGRLAGGVAHDFNNALTAISGYSDLLLEDLEPDDPKRADVAEIRAAAQRAAGLTRQLLAFSRKQVLQTRVLDLNDVVRGLDKMLRRLIGEDVRLEIALSETPAVVRADAGQLEQVILNLAVNARDAMPEGGRLTIETANLEFDDAYARDHQEVSRGRYSMLAVSDTGAGMDAEVLSHLFEPFFTTKEAGKGTGLGLATVYGIVKQSGGSIWTYSEPGHGAVFKIYLPHLDEPHEAQESATAGHPAAGGRETVLLVEDDDAVREIVWRALSGRGYTVLRAPGGSAALEVAGAHPEAIDLLLTDLVMPGMTGRELASALSAERPGLRVLFMSGYTDDAVIRHGVLGAGMPYLEKPFTPEPLFRKVRAVLDAPAQAWSDPSPTD
jgi:two-component system, cell cycle sensor histidine kinase and response regulator CckA